MSFLGCSDFMFEFKQIQNNKYAFREELGNNIATIKKRENKFVLELEKGNFENPNPEQLFYFIPIDSADMTVETKCYNIDEKHN